ncbi:MAG TPA: toll/interleukin-1 receptor domain-containing protein [Allosphingosinicella sp.]|jgi:tetratricopeptide (TPR) repeat protein
MAEAGPGAAGGYVAFISYSHKDAAMGRWLHRKLEGYRLPKRLVGTQGEDGEVPARLTPIFRDRDELPAAGDLSERVRAALAVSRNLIVLCSPNSAASPWVAREIATFRELHPGRPVFTAIVDGEPGQCFSPALLEGGAEPLAADLRKEGDGRRLGLLKLVAGLGGIGLDALVQRDAQRRVRRVTYVTAAAMAAVLAMAVMTTVALNARAEAQRQRAEAEGLVEFMLTDLRSRLRSVGRIDIMEAVNERALRRYSAMERLGPLADEELVRRAGLLRAIGEDEILLGNMEKALAAARQAHRITAAQLERSPGDAKRQLEHARSEYWVGRVSELQRDWPAAQLHYTRYASAAESLHARDPRNYEYLEAASSAAINLGTVQLRGFKDYEQAQRSYEKAAALFGRLAALKPDDPTGLRNQANAYAWLADSYFDRKLWRQSLEKRLEQYRIVQRLARAYPNDVDVSYRLALAERGVGVSYLLVKDKENARAHLFPAYAAAVRLTDSDPRNAEWQLVRAMLGCNILFAEIGLPPGVRPERLRSEVTAVAALLEAEDNPRVADLGPCLSALQPIAKSKLS